MQKILIISTIVLALTSCSDNSPDNQNRYLKSKQISLLTSFKPAFDENSEILYIVGDTDQSLSILLKCKDGALYQEDTFYYKTKVLTDTEVRFLDSTLIKIIPIPVVKPKYKIVDGMAINFNLVKNGDTINRHFHSPSKTEIPLGFLITSKAITTFKTIFNDTIVSDYFDGVYQYIDDSTILRDAYYRPINKLRQQKYGWTLSKPKYGS